MFKCTEADQKHNSVFHLGFYTQQVLLSYFVFWQLLYFTTKSVYLDALLTGVHEMPVFTPFHGHLLGNSSQSIVCRV